MDKGNTFTNLIFPLTERYLFRACVFYSGRHANKCSCERRKNKRLCVSFCRNYDEETNSEKKVLCRRWVGLLMVTTTRIWVKAYGRDQK